MAARTVFNGGSRDLTVGLRVAESVEGSSRWAEAHPAPATLLLALGPHGKSAPHHMCRGACLELQEPGTVLKLIFPSEEDEEI